VKPEAILSGLEAVGVGGQGPQWAVEPVGKVRYGNTAKQNPSGIHFGRVMGAVI
jgi:hypothetical protein